MTGRGTKVGGAMLVIAGTSLYLVDLSDRSGSLHWFAIPAGLLVGIGALFTMFGPIDA